MNNTTTAPRPTWNQLTAAQRRAAFAMNQDNFEQNNMSLADSWQDFMDCFDDTEWASTWANLNRQAN